MKFNTMHTTPEDWGDTTDAPWIPAVLGFLVILPVALVCVIAEGAWDALTRRWRR